MRLPDQAFARIRRCLGLPDTPTDVNDKRASADDADEQAAAQERSTDRSVTRREPRWRLNVDVPCARHGTVDGMLRMVSLRDLSAVGVCIVSSQQLAAGDRFVVYLPWGGGDYAPVPCVAKTVRIRSDGTFRIGAAFLEAGDGVLRKRGRVRTANAVGQEEAEHWFRVATDPHRAADAEHSRQHERTPARGVATIYTYDQDAGGGERRGPLEQVDARDVSDGGVAILRGEPLEVGQRFVIHLAAPGEPAVTKLCRVVHMTLSNNRYRIGAKFVPFPNEAQGSKPGKGLSSKLRKWFRPADAR